MTQSPVDNSTAVPAETDVRPQRPKAAPPQPAFTALPDAWNHNPRRRAIALLAVNFGLFVVACMIFSRLTTGDLFYPRWPLSTYGASLGEFLLDPHISIYRVPPQTAVMALLLSMFVLAPIVVAQFYGRLSAALFLLPLAAVAHVPLLTLAMLPAIWLARSHLFGVPNRFLRGLTAMVFPVAALWVSTARTEFVPKSPMDQIYLHFPWAAGIVLAVVALLLFWVLARLLDYRAVLGPVLLAGMIALTAAIFLVGVGMDELEFRLLNAEYGLDYCFTSGPVDEAVDIDAATVLGRFDEKRQSAEKSCSSFLTRFPRSRYVPYVLYLYGRCQDMRCIARGEQVEYYSSVPRRESRETWQKLLAGYPEHPLAIIARVRLAQLLLTPAGPTAAAVDEAGELLREVRRRRQALKPSSAPRMFLGLQPREPREWESQVGQETQQLEDWLVLLENDHSEDPADRKMIGQLFSLDPHLPGHTAELQGLAATYRGPLAGNLEVLAAMEAPKDAEKVENLRRFLKSDLARTDADARCQAMDKLAGLLVKQKSDPARREAIDLWTRLYHSPNDLFAEEAAGALRTLGVLDLPTQPDGP